MKSHKIIKIDTLKNTNIFRIIFNDEYTESIIDTINAFKVVEGYFEISLGNEAVGDFVGGNVAINFTIF